MGCGNGSDRTQHPAELLGDDWYLYGDWGLEVEEAGEKVKEEGAPAAEQEAARHWIKLQQVD